MFNFKLFEKKNYIPRSGKTWKLDPVSGPWLTCPLLIQSVVALNLAPFYGSSCFLSSCHASFLPSVSKVIRNSWCMFCFGSIIFQCLLIAYTFSTILCINIRSTAIVTIIWASFIICFILAITITNVIWMLIHAACKPRNQHHMNLKSRKNIF